MKNAEEKLISAFKRLIHALTTRKITSFKYGNTTLFRAEVHILERIDRQSGINASDIADSMEVTKGAISQIISKLLNKGLIKKSTKADNLKIQELYLTEKGSEVLSSHADQEKELIDKVSSILENCRTEDIEKFILIINSVTNFTKR
ncbi:MAG: MarR family transcriptional regulator [Desulfobacteraceae bacterium]|nr:MarR family transcriptional regulator [Desulfobacteraceae bacterium]